MFFIAGISGKVKDVGVLEPCPCPACGDSVSLHVCVKYSTPHIFFIPTFRFGVSYLATCPRCASVMELNPQNGKDLERGRPVSADAYGDLRILQNNCRGRCPRCGAQLVPGHQFCGICGERL